MHARSASQHAARGPGVARPATLPQVKHRTGGTKYASIVATSVAASVRSRTGDVSVRLKQRMGGHAGRRDVPAPAPAPTRPAGTVVVPMLFVGARIRADPYATDLSARLARRPSDVRDAGGVRTLRVLPGFAVVRVSDLLPERWDALADGGEEARVLEEAASAAASRGAPLVVATAGPFSDVFAEACARAGAAAIVDVSEDLELAAAVVPRDRRAVFVAPEGSVLAWRVVEGSCDAGVVEHPRGPSPAEMAGVVRRALVAARQPGAVVVPLYDPADRGRVAVEVAAAVADALGETWREGVRVETGPARAAARAVARAVARAYWDGDA